MSTANVTLDILTISPHPDDAEMCVGGFLAKMSALGYRVGVVDLTQGELGTLGTVAIRRAEAERASSILGLTLRENAKFPDGYVGFQSESRTSLENQLKSAVGYIRTYRPKLLLIPYWEERHPDHVGTSQLFEKAIFLSGLKNFEPSLGSPHTPLQTLYYQMRYEFKPSFVVDISAHYQQKLDAINCFASQVSPDQAPASNVLVGTKLHLSALQSRDRHTGSMIGAEYGEAFLVRNAIGITDPVSFFSGPTAGAPLYFPPVR